MLNKTTTNQIKQMTLETNKEKPTSSEPGVNSSWGKEILEAFFKLHHEEELLRLAYRAQKAGQIELQEIICAEIRNRTPQ